jgi:peptide/nickel transport system ATP-binding protein/oligopeptide transport system ATP-binding protein
VQDICRAERPVLRPVTGTAEAGTSDSGAAVTPVTGAAVTPVTGTASNVPSGQEPRPARTAACHFSEEINNV